MNAITANNPLILAQTDTTIGFLCKTQNPINIAKNRTKHILKESRDFEALKTLVRVPRNHKRYVRRARHMTFIYPNGCAVRVVSKNDIHQNVLQYAPILYSSSANLHTQAFNQAYALQVCDIYVLDSRIWKECTPSAIVKLGKKKKQRIR